MARRKTKQHAVLLHGLARTNLSMGRLATKLRSRSYRVHNLNYPSTAHTIEVLADQTLHKVVGPLIEEGGPLIHFVSHSIGGIIIRYYLKHHKVPNLGRVVMLAPPNQGSELADILRDSFYQTLSGPAVGQLGTGPDSMPLNLGPVDFEVGVITGNRSINPLGARLFDGPSDGIVAVERAKVAGMSDFLVLPHSHTFIMLRKGVVDQVIHFLEEGRFERRD
ncbi:MAG: alpha/beta fold hydrolase [Candidatus Marinimicrobia bacterium]|nr:alpha/beta fold hydrolase [Candidatus Neomarinimicrobiota bacterium]